MLERFRDVPQVMHISGDNFLSKDLAVPESYYFSRYPHVWGWATWRRAWQHYDPEMLEWRNMTIQKKGALPICPIKRTSLLASVMGWCFGGRCLNRGLINGPFPAFCGMASASCLPTTLLKTSAFGQMAPIPCLPMINFNIRRPDCRFH